MIVEDLFQGHPISQRKLKELLGHNPSQVLAGSFAWRHGSMCMLPRLLSCNLKSVSAGNFD
ncbi:hypothetical protein OIU74_011245 [Salix koriyanagi]|uniref:Uncharacterized protein n=1 Tax=Salix koriyanagi TaxID=2511006 RepID=A0A9Q0YU70_9ROSI|nr:hypothetical protein OIU74_011245 [Salix koriyanagi]